LQKQARKYENKLKIGNLTEKQAQHVLAGKSCNKTKKQEVK